MKKKRKTKTLTGCVRCGKPYTRRSGFIICSDPKCNYTPQVSMYDDKPKESPSLLGGDGYRTIPVIGSEADDMQTYIAPYREKKT